jgi:hypothetical protein
VDVPTAKAMNQASRRLQASAEAPLRARRNGAGDWAVLSDGLEVSLVQMSDDGAF